MQQTGLEESRFARYAGEFVGTFVLVFAYGCNVLSGNWLSGPTANACVLVALTYCMGSVSGGHLNPAVSLALGVTGLMSIGEAIMYCFVQFLGGIAGALTYSLLFWESFALGPMEGFNWVQAGLAECLYSFMLCFVFLNTVVTRQKGNQSFGLAVGLVYVAGGYGAGSISGGLFNPATALAVDLTSIHVGFGWCALYCGFELVGAAMAGMLFRAVRPEEPRLGEPQRRGPQTAVASEFVGTFLLVTTLGLNAFVAVPINTAWSVAAALASLVLALGDVSGAHFNPAVTLSICLSNAWPHQRSREGTTHSSILPRAIAYIAVQLGAGLLANFFCTVLHGWKSAPAVVYPAGHPESTWHVQLFFEVLFTFLLCFTVLTTATEKTQRPLTQYAGVAIGLSVMAGGYATAAVGGGTLNPAATLGSIWNDTMLLGIGALGRLQLAAGEVLGAALAAGLLHLVHPSAYFRCAAPARGLDGKETPPGVGAGWREP